MVRLAATTVLPVLVLAAVDSRAEELLEKEGIVLTGTARMVEFGAATCRVVEANHSEQVYEQIKENEGQPLHLWELEFSVRNGSGKPLNHLIARYEVDSPWPPCTNWDGAAGARWADPTGHIQSSGGSVSVAAGETLSETIQVVAYHADTPEFSGWSVEYTFADGQWTGPPEAGASANAVPDRAPRAAIEPTCAGKAEGAACWKPLSDRPDCHVWDSHLYTDQTVTWSGACDGGLAQAEGTLTWRRSDADHTTESGRLDDGRKQGHWVLRFADGGVGEGPYVDGERHGHWVLRFADGGVWEGPYADGKKHGHWVLRYADGSVHEGPFVDGKMHGHWVLRLADGGVQEGPYADGNKHGHWVLRFADGGVWEGPYADGKKHGHWVLRYADGSVHEGPFVDGKMHGHWVLRLADGGVEEGPYVDGKMHGHWVWRLAYGGVHEGPFVDGKMHGHWVLRDADGTVEEGPYVDGKRHGHWVWRFTSGHEIQSVYERGDIVDSD